MKRTDVILRAAAILALTLAFALPQARADDKPVTYQATITGIVCNGCKDHIRESFTKLEGVSGVEITTGTAPGTHAVTVTSSAGNLTKEQAIATLGAQASTYGVQTWEKK